MDYESLYQQIITKKSFLCVGLDSDIKKIPECLLSKEDPIFEFNKAIVDATAPYCVSYKPNLAFYEVMGSKGWVSLVKTVKYIRATYPEMFLIADAKRGDIGNTSQMYAKTFFSDMDFDACTIAPYMGLDSVQPFLEFKDKWSILLALTSNPSAEDFELQRLENGEMLYEKVIKTSIHWGSEYNMMYVVGATKASMLADIRKIIPHHFLLVPGVGAQGGSLKEVAEYGMNDKCGLLVNSSRAIIYADRTSNFAKVAAEKAQEVQQEMSELLKKITI